MSNKIATVEITSEETFDDFSELYKLENATTDVVAITDFQVDFQVTVTIEENEEVNEHVFNVRYLDDVTYDGMMAFTGYDMTCDEDTENLFDFLSDNDIKSDIFEEMEESAKTLARNMRDELIAKWVDDFIKDDIQADTKYQEIKNIAQKYEEEAKEEGCGIELCKIPFYAAVMRAEDILFQYKSNLIEDLIDDLDDLIDDLNDK